MMKKHILIDLLRTKEEYSGLGQFSTHFAIELCKQLPKNYFIDFLLPQNSQLKFNHPRVKLIYYHVANKLFPALHKKYDLWHLLNQFPKYFPSKKQNTLMTVHDLNYLVEKKGLKQKKYAVKTQNKVDKVQHLSTISNYSKQDMKLHLELKGKPVHVIYNGIYFGDDINKEKPTWIQEADKFFLALGYLTAKKNFHTLPPILKNFPDYKLVIAGDNSNSYVKEITENVHQHRLQNQVIIPGRVSHANRKWLYENCEAFCFPSLAEGFGMPVIEAMYYGKPTFLSKNTSLPEIGGELAYYFDNFEEEHMTKIVEQGLKHYKQNEKDLSLKIKNHANCFSWEKCIKQYLELYEQILNS